MQEVKWDRGGTKPTGECTHKFFYKKNDNDQLGTGFLVHTKIISAVKWIEFVSDRILGIILSDCWCDIVLNVHGPREDKIDYVKDRLYEE
jgi:hypothetical protein